MFFSFSGKIVTRLYLLHKKIVEMYTILGGEQVWQEGGCTNTNFLVIQKLRSELLNGIYTAQPEVAEIR